MKYDAPHRRTSSRPITALVALGLLASLPGPASAREVAGPGSSQAPYVKAAALPGKHIALLTAGDAVGPVRMAGAPAGLAAMDNLDGSFSVFVSHDIPEGQGLQRRHGSTGGFISEWVYQKATLAPLRGSDLVSQVWALEGTQWTARPAEPFQRLAGLDLADPTAYFHAVSGKGSTARLLLGGEAQANGRALAHIVSGSGKGSSHVLPWADRSSVAAQQVAWQQLRANPGSGSRTLVMAHLGGAQSGLLLYVGDKRLAGNDVERAGLVGGQVWRIEVPGFTTEDRRVDAGLGLVARTTAFKLVGGSGDPLQDRVAGGTRWLDPRDGGWDPLNPRRYYFVTTDRMDAAKDGGLNRDTGPRQKGRSRLWRLTFSDLARPELGGTLELLLDGGGTGEAQQTLASLVVGRDGSIGLGEDPGLNAHPAQLWRYRYHAGTDRFGPLTSVVGADMALFGDVTGPGQLSRAEGFTNLLDANPLLGLPGGPRHCLLTALRDRTPDADPAVVEGGQQLLLCAR